MKYMKTTAERRALLKSQETENDLQSHGWTDGDDYTPLVALEVAD